MKRDGDETGLLHRGLYDHLLTAALSADIQRLGDPRLAELGIVDAEDAHAAVAQYLERLLAASLSTLRGKDSAERQRRLVDRVIATLADELGEQWQERLSLVDPLQRLLAVHAQPASGGHRPDTPLARSALLTGTRLDPALGLQLGKEFAAADRVDILCSFIKWSGLRQLLGPLAALTAHPHPDGPRLRVITTSYMGATDPKAVDALTALPNTEVRVSYDTRRTRLHAKSYIVHRNTGFGSAYVGSANISAAALSEGLEWTSKISQYELPHLWQKLVATFDTYWNDPEFEPYDARAADRLRDAIDRERTRGTDSSILSANFDLRPYPFQQEILDAIAAEREINGKTAHLVVAATGTGKTMIAAFDYRRWCESAREAVARSSVAAAGTAEPSSVKVTTDRPSLLYIAHREEILKQAIGTFRGVLRDQNFGDLLVGQNAPAQARHLFCSIQSFNSRDMHLLDAGNWDYVVVDEFHHAAASSYQSLLDCVRPRVLLGLTATPERTDGLDVLRWFGGEATAQVRLPDAIGRRLLCPFQYFGISDCVDLDGLKWQRGGYSIEDLDRAYTGNDARALLVLQKVIETVLDPRQARGLGFCVSIAHAAFMAGYFTQHGIPSIALSAETPPDQRRAARARLVSREVNFIFVVDLYNEGVDIPEIDTVLFLRPTESLTLFLQQLGRGLRMHDGKDCLTVLDFIGTQHKQFRFASRFRALVTEPTARLEKEVDANFPHLPAGCSITLERVAQQRVLENIRQAMAMFRPQMVNEIRQLGQHLGRRPTLREALDYLDVSLDSLLKRGLWSRLLSDAGLADQPNINDEAQLASGIRHLAHIEDPRQIRLILTYLDGSAVDTPAARSTAGALAGPLARETPSPSDEPLIDPLADCRLAMLHISLWGKDGLTMTVEQADQRLRAHAAAVSDLRQVLQYRLHHTQNRRTELMPDVAGPLALHAHYTRDEILVALRHWDLNRRPDMREGVLHVKANRVDAFFITLDKTEGEYSPTTMYEDYWINDRLFHWQSQSTTSDTSPTGQRYIRHRELGYTPLLFVREHRHTPGGLASPYAFLGPADCLAHKGSNPISIHWQLRHPAPTRLVRKTAV